MASEGSREIEAARLRLAAAKSQVSTASKNMDLVTKMMDNAKDMFNAADKEYAEAQIMLAAAEKRWEVIDVDVDDPEPTDNSKGSNKRRKVSLSPQSNNNNNSSRLPAATASTTRTTSVQSNDTTNVRGQSTDRRVTATTPNNVNEIVVRCGIPYLNGTYTRGVRDGVVDGSAVEYVRVGLWKDCVLDYVICLYRDDDYTDSPNTWKMGFVKRDGLKELQAFYSTPNDANRLCPPENGWLATDPEYSSPQNLPLPTCQLITAPISMRSSFRHPQTLKKCGKCGIEKKKHSYLVVQWDKSEDSERVCQVCSKKSGNYRGRVRNVGIIS